MLNICVKNVNNQRVIDSITGDYVSTNVIDQLYRYISSWLQRLFINQIIPFISTILSTYKNTINNLLNKSFTHYPQRLLLELINEN